MVARDLSDNIHGPLFAEAAEVESHAALREEDVAGSALHFFPADKPPGCDEFILGGQARIGGFVIPEPQQRQRGGIEHALRHEMKPVAKGEQALHLGVDGDGRDPGRGVDA
jgi:hypothetical protein